MFKVFENDHPADETGFPHMVGFGWTEVANTHKTFADAIDYANHWLGDYPGGAIQSQYFQENVPVDYNGYGDTIEIRRV